MHRNKILFSIILFFVANIAIAQTPVDTITIQVIRDASTYKIICNAQKVNFGVSDTTYTSFTLADTVGGAYTFDWGGDFEPLADGFPRARYEFTTEGMYAVTLSVYEDATGITYTDSRTISAPDIIRVPNVFTPNDDGVNDLFVIRANGIDAVEISIFTRTGTQVFTSKSPIIVWDGRNASGAKVSPGVYYYVLTSESPNVEPQNGFIHIYYEKE